MFISHVSEEHGERNHFPGTPVARMMRTFRELNRQRRPYFANYQSRQSQENIPSARSFDGSRSNRRLISSQRER
jgi:hypothetical protein